MDRLEKLPLGWLLSHLRKIRRAFVAQKHYKQKWPTCKLLGENTIEEGVTLGNGCILNQTKLRGKVTIGRHTLINFMTEISGEVTIGNFCSIARNVLMITGTHPLDSVSSFHCNHSELKSAFRFPLENPKPIYVGSDVWIGAGAILLPGANIGHGAVIGAGAVVTKSIEPYSIAVGCPAKPVRYRFSQKKAKLLLASKWWQWPDETILTNKEFFSRDIANASFELTRELFDQIKFEEKKNNAICKGFVKTNPTCK